MHAYSHANLCEVDPEPVDLLHAIFDRQRRFRDRVNPVISPLNDKNFCATPAELEQVEHEVQKYALCILMEGAELMDWTRWKHWSQRLGNKQPIGIGSPGHIQEMRTEIADILCFLVNAAMSLGMDADTLNKMHADKVGVNHLRQNSGGY